MGQIVEDLHEINRELGQVDLLRIAFRIREALRRTRSLLDGNVAILFEGQPASVPEDLYNHISYAEGHIRTALAEEYDFDVIKKHLRMATALAEYAVEGVAAAVDNLR
jgi:hypothetical protein